MDVSIIILNYKSKKLIIEQLRNFYSRTCRLSIEVLVVDNCSHDGISADLAALFPDVRCIESPENRGYGAGNNLGLKEAKGAYAFVANPDIVLTADAVEKLYVFMEQHPKAGIAGPRITNADGTLQYTSVRFPDWHLPLYRRTALGSTKRGAKWLDQYFMRDWDHETAATVDWLFGSCLIVRMDAVRTVGYFDEGFFLYLEDTDWCRRFWERGYEVWYAPVVSVIHLLGRSSEGAPWSLVFNRTARIHLRSFFRYMWKYRKKSRLRKS